jgi:type I restriction enzyme S subunit
MSWPLVTLNSVAALERDGETPSALSPETRYVGLEHVDGDGAIAIIATVGTAEPKSTKFRFSEDHILYGKLRPYLRKIARPGFAGVCSTDIIPIRPTSAIDRGYLFHFLRSPKMVALATSRCTGANLPRLSPSQLEAFEVPLPPLPEQKRIAAILDAADALRAKRRESIEQLDSLVHVTFLEMFGATLSNWEQTTVDQLAAAAPSSVRTGPFGSQLLHSEFTDEGVRVLGIDNAVANEFREGAPRFISLAKYEQLRRYTVIPGDVLITIMGTCGRCAIVPEGIGAAINTKHLCCITLDKKRCLPRFLHAYFLRHPVAQHHLRSQTKGAIMEGLNMGIIKALPVGLPPIDLQTRFASIVESIEQQKARLKAHLVELDSLFASLQSRAFGGEQCSGAVSLQHASE